MKAQKFVRKVHWLNVSTIFDVKNKTIAAQRGADESQLPRQPLSLDEDGQREFFSRRDPGESSNA